MFFLAVLLIIVIVFLAYLFFAPFYIEINSNTSLYRLRLHRMASVSFFVDNDPVKMELGFLIWKRKINFSATRPKAEQKKEIKNKKSWSNISLTKIIGVIKSFKINVLNATFDFGDMQINGILYPLFYWISFKTKKNILVNFRGNNSLVIEIENSLARMIWAYFNS